MKLSVKEITIFGMFGALMFASKIAMEALPNIHLIGVFIVSLTVVYRAKALFPIYIYVLLTGLSGGFNMWWVPYLYIWTVLWGAVMLLPKKLPPKIAPIVYMTVCALHGFLYGTLYAPVQALMFRFTLKQTLAWISAGLTFDMIHGIGNFALGLLIVPLIKVIRLAEKKPR